MKILLTALLLIIAHNSFADGLYIGAWSYHPNRDDWRDDGWELNENNQLIAYRHGKYTGGHFYNSFGDSTVFVSVELASKQIYDFKATLYGGATHGYPYCGNRSKPKNANYKAQTCGALMPEIRYTRYRLQPAFFLMERNIVALGLFWDID
jgi:hypothetical protein